MKQIIKQATVYSAPLPTAGALQDILTGCGFAELLSLQTKTLGFVPREEFTEIVQTFPGGVAFTVRVDQKVIPPSLIKSEVAERCKLIDPKPGKKQRKEIKLEVIDELAKVALIRTQLVTCFHHTASNLLLIPAGKKLAGEIVSTLVYAIGSLKTTTINISDIKQGLTKRLKDWLEGDDDAFNGLFPSHEVVMATDEQRVSVKMGDLAWAKKGLQESLASGFTVKSLGLTFQSGLDLKLTDEFGLRSIWVPLVDDESGEAPEFGRGSMSTPSYAPYKIAQRVKPVARVFHDSERKGTYFKEQTLSPQRDGATKRRFKNREAKQ